jgi:hemolysin activation/secretion protein
MLRHHTQTKRRFGAALALLLSQSMLIPLAYAQQAEPAPSQTFTIEAFDVSGNKQLTELQIGEAVYPFLGPNKTINDIEGARKALEAAYRKLGLETVVVEIPIEAQADGSAKLTAKFGIVPIKVTEATIGRVRVVGAEYHSPKLLKDQVPVLKEGGVPDLRAMQSQINEANRNPDRQVTPLLKAGQVPGTIDVDLKVKDTLPFHANLHLSNDHSAETSDLRLGATVRYTNLWQLGHSISGTYLVSPKDRSESEIFSGSYLAPLWGTPWSFLLYGYTSNSAVATLGGTSVLGDGYSIGARAIVKLPAAENSSQSLNFGVDYKNFNENLLVPASGETNPGSQTTTPIDYPAFVASYSYQASTEKSGYNFTAGATFGLRGIGIPDSLYETEATRITDAAARAAFCSGNTEAVSKLPTNYQGSDPTSLLFGEDCYRVQRVLAGGFKFKRASSISNFMHFKIDLDYTRELGKDWSTFAKFSGQIGDSPLTSNEQFSAGGLDTIRGYYQSEAVGDDGLAGSFELRSPNIGGYLGDFAEDISFYGFVDGARIRVRDALLEQTDSFSLLSAGVGTRFRLFKYFSGHLVAGFPLMDADPNKDGVSTKKGDQKIQFNVRAEF